MAPYCFQRWNGGLIAFAHIFCIDVFLWQLHMAMLLRVYPTECWSGWENLADIFGRWQWLAAIVRGDHIFHSKKYEDKRGL